MKHKLIPALATIASLCALPLTAAENPAAYATPQDALDAMMAGLVDQNPTAILEVFGSDAAEMLSSGNADRDSENRSNILRMFEQGYRFQPNEDGGVTLLLGAEGWPFPIPMIKTESGWAFDIVAGADEVYFRRIGLNEMDAIDILKAYVAIQADFRKSDVDGDGVMEFANALLSSPEARDGLFWGDEDSPLGIRIAMANLDGYSDEDGDQDPEPFGGYYYRVLQGQTDAAPGGAMDYMMGPNMVAGHALLAVPADYGESGIHSFMVSENGIVMEADLGDESLEQALNTMLYDPTEAWSAVE